MKKMKGSVGNTVFDVVVHLLLLLGGLMVLYPLVYVVSASFSTPVDVISGKVWLWPVRPTLLAYQQVFKNKLIGTGYLNTIFYAVSGTIISVTVTICAAYPLSRKKLAGRSIFSRLFIFATLFSGGLIPFYLVVRNMGMLHSRWAVVVPVALNVFHIILMRTHIQTAIPEEMLESAEIDGCSHFGKLVRMILPLSGSILAVLVLYNVVGQWNSYFIAMIFLKDLKMYPLQIILRDILIMNSVTSTMTVNISEMILKQGLVDVLKYSLIVVSSAPLLIVYPFIQKYFVKGVMMGSLKG
jgi:ABC-type glycerol-3-phosphate transport system permease component